MRAAQEAADARDRQAKDERAEGFRKRREELMSEFTAAEAEAKEAEEAVQEATAFAEAHGDKLDEAARAEITSIRGEASELLGRFELLKAQLAELDAEEASREQPVEDLAMVPATEGGMQEREGGSLEQRRRKSVAELRADLDPDAAAVRRAKITEDVGQIMMDPDGRPKGLAAFEDPANRELTAGFASARSRFGRSVLATLDPEGDVVRRTLEQKRATQPDATEEGVRASLNFDISYGFFPALEGEKLRKRPLADLAKKLSEEDKSRLEEAGLDFADVASTEFLRAETIMETFKILESAGRPEDASFFSYGGDRYSKLSYSETERGADGKPKKLKRPDDMQGDVKVVIKALLQLLES